MAVLEYHQADIIQDLNPLTIEHIRIPAVNGTTFQVAANFKLPQSIQWMGNFYTENTSC